MWLPIRVWQNKDNYNVLVAQVKTCYCTVASSPDTVFVQKTRRFIALKWGDCFSNPCGMNPLYPFYHTLSGTACLQSGGWRGSRARLDMCAAMPLEVASMRATGYQHGLFELTHHPAFIFISTWLRRLSTSCVSPPAYHSVSCGSCTRQRFNVLNAFRDASNAILICDTADLCEKQVLCMS